MQAQAQAQAPGAPTDTLYVKVTNVKFAVDKETLSLVFAPVGGLQSITILPPDGNGDVSAIVAFDTVSASESALMQRNGRCIYADCNRMNIRFMQMDRAPATRGLLPVPQLQPQPAMVSQLPSHNAPMAVTMSLPVGMGTPGMVGMQPMMGYASTGAQPPQPTVGMLSYGRGRGGVNPRGAMALNGYGRNEYAPAQENLQPPAPPYGGRGMRHGAQFGGRGGGPLPGMGMQMAAPLSVGGVPVGMVPMMMAPPHMMAPPTGPHHQAGRQRPPRPPYDTPSEFISAAKIPEGVPLQRVFDLFETFAPVIWLRRNSRSRDIVMGRAESVEAATQICRVMNGVPFYGKFLNCKTFPDFVQKQLISSTGNPNEPETLEFDFTNSTHRPPEHRTPVSIGITDTLHLSGITATAEQVLAFLAERDYKPVELVAVDGFAFKLRFENKAVAVKVLAEYHGCFCGEANSVLKFDESLFRVALPPSVPVPGAPSAAVAPVASTSGGAAPSEE